MASNPIELDHVPALPSNGVPRGNTLLREPRNNSPSDQQPRRQEFSLPPVDSGKDAWFFLAACWAIEALVWGFGFSFGVFQDFYSTHEPFSSSGNIAVIGTTTTGTMYIGTLGVISLCRVFPRWARWFPLAGLFTSSLAMAMSSFCTSAAQLTATQGFLFGVGGCFAIGPCVLYIDEWFVQRKGMAYGIMWSAAGFGGVLLPLLLEYLLNRLGFETAIRIWAGILFAASAPLSYFIKPRLPYSVVTHVRPFEMRYVASKVFIFHQLANVIQASGYFLPNIYLPTYARSIFETSSFMSALTVLLVNIAATVGCVIMGSMTDKMQVTTCITISAVGTTTAVTLIWGLSSSLPVLYLFCVVYGLFAGCWSALWPGIMREVVQQGQGAGSGHVDPIMVFAWLCMGRGVGNVVSGPLSESLIKSMPWQGETGTGYGSGYGGLIVFTGITGLLSGMNAALKCLGFV